MKLLLGKCHGGATWIHNIRIHIERYGLETPYGNKTFQDYPYSKGEYQSTM